MTVRVDTGTAENYGEGRTGADGTFSILGLEAGTATLSLDAPSPAWAPPGVKGIQLSVGKEARIPDIQVNHGIELTGQVFEQDTHLPVVGAKAYADGPFGGATSTASDAQGRYTMHVAAGSNRFYLVSRPPDYIPEQGMGQITLDIKAESRKAPDMTLRRGVTAAGTAFDENGKPATGAVITVGDIFSGKNASVDEKGNWVLRGLDPSRKTRLTATGDWDISGNTTLNLPTPPLRLQLRHIQRADVTVKVVDSEGQPVGGADVTAKTALGEGSYSFSRFVTNQRGEVVMTKLRPDAQIELTATKTGYVLVKSGVVSSNGPLAGKGVLQASNVVLSSLNAKVSGRVVDAQGKPVAGVRVAALGYDGLPMATEVEAGRRGIVTTDAKGNFTLEGLRAGDVIVGAAHGREFGVAATTTKAAQPLELKLVQDTMPPAPADWEAGFAYVEAQAKLDNKQEYLWQEAILKLVPHNPERALKLAGSFQTNDPDSTIADLIVQLAKQDPVLAIKLGGDRLGKAKNPATRRNLELSFAVLTAQADPQNARKIYDNYAAVTETTNFAQEHAYDFAYLVGLAGSLKNPDAEGWTQALTMTVTTMPTDEAMFRIGGYAEIVAQGSPAAAETFLAGLSPIMQVRALEDVIPAVGKNDPKAALKLLAHLEELVAQPDLPVEADRNDGMYRPKPTDSLSRAREELAKILLATDPKTAYELASKMDANNSFRKVPLMGQAAVKLPREAAITALRATFEVARTSGNSWTGTMAQTAAFAMLIDPKLGEEFFQTNRTRFSEWNKEDDDYNGLGIEVTNYAFYRAPFAPDESRLLLENEWQNTLKLLKNGKADDEEAGGERDRQFTQLGRIASAMSAVSMARSQAMFAELNGFNRANHPFANSDILQARTHIFDWIIASEAERPAVMLY